MKREKHDTNKGKRPIFGPATSLFVGRSPLWGCSLLTPRGRPKSLAVPSTVIYEMTSRLCRGLPSRTRLNSHTKIFLIMKWMMEDGGKANRELKEKWQGIELQRLGLKQ